MPQPPDEPKNTVAAYNPAIEAAQATNSEIVSSILDDLLGADAWTIPIPPTEPAMKREGFDCYSADRHIAVCKLVSLGLNFEHAAQAIGIGRSTLNNWRKAHPNLDRDIKMAQWLAVGAVTKLLRKLMTSANEAVALNAVKYFLSTRAPEFREKVEATVELNFEEIAKKVTSEVYGQHGAARSQKLIADGKTPSDSPSAATAVVEESTV